MYKTFFLLSLLIISLGCSVATAQMQKPDWFSQVEKELKEQEREWKTVNITQNSSDGHFSQGITLERRGITGVLGITTHIILINPK
jgi:hypothetical protein